MLSVRQAIALGRRETRMGYTRSVIESKRDPGMPQARELLTSPTAVARLLESLPDPDCGAVDQVRERERRLTKPSGALGRLEELTEWLAAWQGRYPPRLERPAARVFAGNHGIVVHGVSAFPAAVTAQMVGNFESGGAAVSRLCRMLDVDLRTRSLALDRPAFDFTAGASLSEGEFGESFAAGFAAAEEGIDVLCLGEMGIGNTTAAAALAHALYGGRAAAWVGPGTGVDGERLAAKRRVVAAGVRRHTAETDDSLELLRRLGGRELAAIAGAVVGARLHRIPVLLDGFVCTAAAAVLAVARPGALDHCRVAHVSAEPGHRLLLRRLQMRPLLDLDMRLGEASGAVLAVALLRAALACHLGMATFDDAGVSGRDDA
jgi:nicotinate-nucleotide--dimethylbenzimidazole phosphoribosyltransferase